MRCGGEKETIKSLGPVSFCVMLLPYCACGKGTRGSASTNIPPRWIICVFLGGGPGPSPRRGLDISSSGAALPSCSGAFASSGAFFISCLPPNADVAPQSRPTTSSTSLVSTSRGGGYPLFGGDRYACVRGGGMRVLDGTALLAPARSPPRPAPTRGGGDTPRKAALSPGTPFPPATPSSPLPASALDNPLFNTQAAYSCVVNLLFTIAGLRCGVGCLPVPLLRNLRGSGLWVVGSCSGRVSAGLGDAARVRPGKPPDWLIGLGDGDRCCRCGAFFDFFRSEHDESWCEKYFFRSEHDEPWCEVRPGDPFLCADEGLERVVD